MQLFNSKISIDEFGGTSKAYVLTHWHSDHVIGITKCKVPVICSRTTAKILQHFRKGVRVKIVDHFKKATIAGIPVVFLPACHVPGSIMLYFPHNKILYTGDYRLTNGMIRFFSDNIYDLDRLYLDTTFHDSSVKLVSHSTSRRLYQRVINWLHVKGESPVIAITHAGQCGIAYNNGPPWVLGQDLPTHLKQTIKLMYGEPDGDHDGVQKCVKIVYAPNWWKKQSERKSQKCTIIPCALWFACRGVQRDPIHVDGDRNIRICYSGHSSYTENQRVIGLLNPKKIIALNKKPRANLQCLRVTRKQ